MDVDRDFRLKQAMHEIWPSWSLQNIFFFPVLSNVLFPQMKYSLAVLIIFNVCCFAKWSEFLAKIKISRLNLTIQEVLLLYLKSNVLLV